MAKARDEFLLNLLQACADRAPDALYPARYSQEHAIDRVQLDEALDELRRRGLIQFTDWVKDLGQGRALTDAGTKALATRKLGAVAASTSASSGSARVLTYDRGEIVRLAVLEPIRPYVSWTLLAINVIVFFAGALYAGLGGFGLGDYLTGEPGGRHSTGEVLSNLGGLTRPDVLYPFGRPQLERLILSCFLHLGIVHLLMNMFFLGTLGGMVEAMWGRWRFLTIYFVAGLVGGCVVLMVGPPDPPGEVKVTIGASGALCGLSAALVVWFALNHQHLPEQAFQNWSLMIGINLVLLFSGSFVGGVSWQGHLGGAIGGLLAALLLHAQRFHPSRAVRIFALLGVPLIPAAFLGITFWKAGWF